MRLEPPRLSTFHILTDRANLGRIQGVTGKRPLLE